MSWAPVTESRITWVAVNYCVHSDIFMIVQIYPSQGTKYISWSQYRRVKVHVNDTICICKDLDNRDFFHKRDATLQNSSKPNTIRLTRVHYYPLTVAICSSLSDWLPFQVAFIVNFHSSDDNDTCKIDSPVFINFLVDSTACVI